MRRTAGAARPASAALIRRRRDGDLPTLRDSLIYLLLEGVAFARDARNLAMLRQPGLVPSRERVAAATCRLPSPLRRSDGFSTPGEWSVEQTRQSSPAIRLATVDPPGGVDSAVPPKVRASRRPSTYSRAPVSVVPCK